MTAEDSGLEPFVEGSVWVRRVPLLFFGLPMGTRMTVVRLRDPGPLRPLAYGRR